MTAKIIEASKENIIFLSNELKKGELVAMPTETVYGLACDATNVRAVKKIYQTKNRPNLNPLIAHYSDLDELAKDVILNEKAIILAKKFWGGPLTLVLKKSKNCRIVNEALAGLDTVAVRIPAHKIAQEFLSYCNFPVVAPSANISGKLSPVSASHVAKTLGNSIKWILDGGSSIKGIESTIIDLSNNSPTLLRAGSITIDEISKALNLEINLSKSDIALAPGMKYPHYKPTCKIRLNIDNPTYNEGLLAFGLDNIPSGYKHILNLSPSANLEEAARNLFDFLHKLEDLKVERISVMPIPNQGIGVAINDKLQKAAQ